MTATEPWIPTDAEELTRRLGETPFLCAVPGKRLLRDLVEAVSRSQRDSAPLMLPGDPGSRPPASWYRDVQAEHARRSAKPRTVEFSGLAVDRLSEMFPSCQFILVRNFDHLPARSRRIPPLPPGRLLEVPTTTVDDDATLDRILAFLGEGWTETIIDLADRPHAVPAPR